jgi:chromosomal replication initiation ATPase DnaA
MSRGHQQERFIAWQLNCLVTENGCKFKPVEIKLEPARDWLRIAPPKKPIGVLAEIIERVGQVCKVEPQQIKSCRRDANIARARQLVMWLAWKKTGYSFPRIGTILDRDHATVMHGCKKVEKAPEKFEPELSLLRTWLHERFDG